LAHNQALADIILIVKGAARADEPIYTAVEGIERAMASVMVGKSFNEEQLKWLGYIQ